MIGTEPQLRKRHSIATTSDFYRNNLLKITLSSLIRTTSPDSSAMRSELSRPIAGLRLALVAYGKIARSTPLGCTA